MNYYLHLNAIIFPSFYLENDPYKNRPVDQAWSAFCTMHPTCTLHSMGHHLHYFYSTNVKEANGQQSLERCGGMEFGPCMEGWRLKVCCCFLGCINKLFVWLLWLWWFVVFLWSSCAVPVLFLCCSWLRKQNFSTSFSHIDKPEPNPKQQRHFLHCALIGAVINTNILGY